jgi:hypothetical protein
VGGGLHMMTCFGPGTGEQVEELWSQKMYQSRDSNAKAVATTEAKRLMAALEAKVSLMDERVVTNTTNTTHVASMLEIKMADVANQMEWSKQVLVPSN